MTERASCPACGPECKLRSLEPAARHRLELERCDGCGGVLASRDGVAAALDRHGASHPALVERPGPPRCRRCLAPVRAGVTRCSACGSNLVLACPRCRGSMSTVEVAGVVVDVCRGCEVAFFDRGELGRVARSPGALARALQRPTSGDAVAEGVLEAVAYGPLDVEVVALGVEAAGVAGEASLRAASAVVQGVAELGPADAARAAGEASLEAAEVAVEASGSVAEGLLEVFSAIFD